MYQLVLDRSGSLSAVATETVAGFNEQVQRIREMNERFPHQDIRVNLCLFNHRVQHQLFDVRAADLEHLLVSAYQPGGMTGLYDAVGDSIRRVKQQIRLLETEARVKVFFVILTDGHENASRCFTYEKIATQIAGLEETRKWSFSYLGSTLDAVEIAESLNIKKSNAVYFQQKHVKTSFRTVSDRMMDYFSDIAHTADQEDEE